MVELDELLFRWQQGENISQLSRSLGQSRQTVREYLRRAQHEGLTRDADDARRAEVVRTLLRKAPTVASPARDELVPWLEQIRQWLAEPDMTAKQVWRLLRRKGLKASYQSVNRFVQEYVTPATPRTTMRLETPAGRQAQVDFGKVRVRLGDTLVWLWAFVMTLSYSRHRFVRFVPRQDLPSWLDCHVRAFEFFGGVPETILLDNLKAGVVRPDLYDPTINRAYAELERHYGFVADPAKVRTPEHKGKVERSMPVVRQQLVAGRGYADLTELNEAALSWCQDEVGTIDHGTTQEPPLIRFERDERKALKPLPAATFANPTWAECKVHPDHHVVFERSYYSVPTRYVGKTVWVRATFRLVEIFCNEELIKTHPRAHRRGTWQTDQNDYPPPTKAFLFFHPAHCKAKAGELGPDVARMMAAILADNALRNLRKGQALLRLGEKYGPERLNEACRHLLSFDSTELKRLQQVLERGVPTTAGEPPDTAPLSQQTLEFLHPGESFAAGGAQ
ncbi:IS21 family transposase [Geobacter sp.]|uniref:IS21 family transposase n=1 Tax=Geobacter sp. TaxID=46610 RepID=UPI0026089B4C|nr:IS21 family transposase [Geobacter sp.]